jgi:hypothetical protein
MHLFRSDFQTATWRRLTQTLEAELQQLRESNDVVSNDPVKTAVIRGQIKAVKKMLALPQDGSASQEAALDE